MLSIIKIKNLKVALPQINFKIVLGNRSYYVDDDADTSNTSCNFESETPFREERINEKIIDNAIKTEKTMRKYFQDNFNPKLQPNER